MGNPELPALIEEGIVSTKNYWLGADLGYWHEGVLNLKVNILSGYPATVQDFSSYTDAAVISLLGLERFSVYGAFGGEAFYFSHNPTATQKNTYQTTDQVTWMIGGRGLVFQFSDIGIGFDVKYQGAQPTFSNLTIDGTPVSVPSNAGMHMRAWQFGLGLTYAMDLFYPYIGVCYSSTSIMVRQLPEGFLPHGTSFKLVNGTKFGLAVGVTLATGRFFYIDLEARLIDEEALNFTWQFRF